MPATSTALPFTDSKPVGAADFYAAVNATFRFILREQGMEGLRRYWLDLGERYHAPVTRLWREGGLAAVAEYWRAFFAAEPGAEVELRLEPDEVVLEVRTCPAFAYLRAHGREIVPCFCQHCHYVSAAMGEGAGVDVRVAGGNGACTQRFALNGHFVQPQRLEDIATAS